MTDSSRSAMVRAKWTCVLVRFLCLRSNPDVFVASETVQTGPVRAVSRAGRELRRMLLMRRSFWAILSLGLCLVSIPAWAQTACNLVTSSGTPTQSDVNAAINMAIGASPCTANIMGPSVCNVVVVQRVVNAAMGQPCIVGTHGVTVSWAAATPGTYPIAGYNVYRSTTNGNYVQINPALVTSSLSFTDGAVSNGVTYYYAIKSADTQGNLSAYSTPVTAGIPSS